jgi:hypothetical protein
MWVELNEKITDILEANTAIADVYDHEAEEFKGDPVALVTASGNESDYLTTTENARIYAFNIRLMVDRTARDDHEAERVLRELVDTVVDDFDKNYTLSGIVNPTGKTFMNLEALPSEWGYIEGQVIYRFADITLKCKVLVDVNLIS